MALNKENFYWFLKEYEWRFNGGNHAELLTFKFITPYPVDIRKAIYTTNTIDSLNSVIRKAIKNRKVFPNYKAAMKVVYLGIEAAPENGPCPSVTGKQHWTAL